MRIWSRGTMVPAESLRIDVRDVALEHGLGLFETFRTWKGRPVLLPRHIERLRRSARELGLGDVPSRDLPDAAAVQQLTDFLRRQAPGPIEDFRIRITLTGGRTDRQSSAEERRPVVWMTAAPFSASSALRTAVVRGEHLVAPDDPLARHKTLNYWRRRIANERAAAEGADETLFLTPDGLVQEGARSNVFFVNGARLVTPGLEGPILPGTMRGLVLGLARDLGMAIVEGPVSRADLHGAEEAFLTNSVRGVLPIGTLWERTLSAPGPWTRRIGEAVLSWLERGGTHS